MVNAQEWLNKEYPFEERKLITNLFVAQKKLVGFLDLNEFINLKELYCHDNQLTSLDISSCEKIVRVNCSKNKMVKLFLPKKGEKLNWLYLTNNQLEDLNIFSHLMNLESLFLDNNPFFGSLEPLTTLKELRAINISNTNIDDLGLEFSLKKPFMGKLEVVWCSGTKLDKVLKTYNYNLRDWEKFCLSKQIEEEKRKIPTLEKEIEKLTSLIKEQKEKIITAYTHFFQEKELLQQLITAHLEYGRAKNQGLPVFKLRKTYNQIYDELTEKISEEMMEEVEIILKECEKLIHWEFELQYHITHNQRLIANKQQEVKQIIYNIQSINVSQGTNIIGNQSFGDSTNLSYRLSEVLETKIELPPKNA